jgi:hypothetical protein
VQWLAQLIEREGALAVLAEPLEADAHAGPS